MSTLYETDFYSWTLTQAQRLRDAASLRPGQVPELDWQDLAEEVEDLGLSLERELYARFTMLLSDLLKWSMLPSHRGTSSQIGLAEQRFAIARLLRKNPGLQSKVAGEFDDAWTSARLKAALATGLALAAMPETCPFSVEQAMDETFFPEGAV
ncbi:MAG: DUF29 domain-containing protein [Geminicoccaceae bacterium]